MDRFAIAKGQKILGFQDLKYEYKPNFSVIVPGDCNAKCSFCFWEYETPHKKYLARLKRVIKQLPEDIFTQVSLTGGEPTLNSDLSEIIRACKERFGKVVLTTNGTKLRDYIASKSSLPDFINISRHGKSFEECAKVFHTEFIPSDSDILWINKKLARTTVRSTMNVVCPSFDKLDIEGYILYAKSLQFSSLCFRKDHTKGKDTTDLAYPVEYKNENPVSKTLGYEIEGMPVEFRSSELESTEVVDYCHELIFHPDGNLTLDWEGKITMAIDEDLLLALMDEVKSLQKEVSELKRGSIQNSKSELRSSISPIVVLPGDGGHGSRGRTSSGGHGGGH